jgi:hypothetical protein
VDLALRRDRPAGRHQRLAGHLPAEHPHGRVRRAHAAEDVLLDALEIEQRHQPVEDRLPARWFRHGVEIRGRLPCRFSHALARLPEIFPRGHQASLAVSAARTCGRVAPRSP